jgi:hypothetical protein
MPFHQRIQAVGINSFIRKAALPPGLEGQGWVSALDADENYDK